METSKGHCSICGHNSREKYAESLILGKFHARHLACNQCGHEWLENPTIWLSDAYTSPIANTDTGIVTRSLNLLRIISSFLSLNSKPGPILDWGSGSGLLVRLLRDRGHASYGFEPYTVPVLAAGFTIRTEEAAASKAPFRAVLAIEVLEHLEDPKAFMASVLSITDTLIFTTELLENNRVGKCWWYYSTETGQHISFYTRISLKHLASYFGCMYYSCRNQGLHIFTRLPSDMRAFKLIAGSKRSLLFYPISRLIARLSGRRSLTIADHLTAKESLLAH